MVAIYVQFRWTPMYAKTNEEVVFTEDSDNITMLDFGDGRMTTDKMPVYHTYKKAGKYAVVATAKTPEGIGTYSQFIYVEDRIVIDPKPDPTPEPTPVPTPEPSFLQKLIAAIMAVLNKILGK